MIIHICFNECLNVFTDICITYVHDKHIYYLGVERRAVWNAEEEAWTVQKLVHCFRVSFVFLCDIRATLVELNFDLYTR